MNRAKAVSPAGLCDRSSKGVEASIVAVSIALLFGVVRSEATVLIPLPAPVNEVEVWPLNAETALVIVPYSGFAEMVSRKGTTNIFRGHGGRWNWDEKNRIVFVPPMTLCTMATNSVRALDFSKWVERVIFTNRLEIKYVAQMTNFVLVQLASGTTPYQLVSTATGEVKWTVENLGGKVVGMNEAHFYLNRPNEPSLHGLGLSPHELRCFSTETGKQVWSRQISCFYGLDQARIFEDLENVWVESGGLHWLDAKTGKMVREGAVSALGFAKLNGSVFVAAREPTGIVPPDCCGDVRNAVVYEVKGRKGVLLPYRISDPFHDGRRDGRKERTSFYQTVWPFGTKHLIFSGMWTRCYRLEDGELEWEKRGQYKTQNGRTVFTMTGGDAFVLRRFDIENGKEEVLASYSEEELFGK